MIQKIGSMSREPLRMTTSQVFGSTRGMLSTNPPPVMWAKHLITCKLRVGRPSVISSAQVSGAIPGCRHDGAVERLHQRLRLRIVADMHLEQFQRRPSILRYLQTQNLARLAFGDHLKRPAADF